MMWWKYAKNLNYYQEKGFIRMNTWTHGINLQSDTTLLADVFEIV